MSEILKSLGKNCVCFFGISVFLSKSFFEVLPEMMLILFFKKNESSLLNMSFNIECSCHTITNIKHGRRLSLQLMTN